MAFAVCLALEVEYAMLCRHPPFSLTHLSQMLLGDAKTVCDQLNQKVTEALGLSGA